MAMSKRVRKELGKLRELTWLLLDGKRCCFCKELLLPDPGIEIRFGNGTGLPLTDLNVTEHHRDGNHDNNDPRNLALCHESCHRSHHAREVFAANRQQARWEQGLQ